MQKVLAVIQTCTSILHAGQGQGAEGGGGGGGGGRNSDEPLDNSPKTHHKAQRFQASIPSKSCAYLGECGTVYSRLV